VAPPRKPSTAEDASSAAVRDAPVIVAEGEKRAVTIARAILRDIREDRLVAGDRLPPEATMLTRYQVARGTLREALRVLEVQGLISLKSGRVGGPVVNDPTPRDFSRVLTLFLQGMEVTMADLLDARRSVEPVMARLAAASSDQEKLDELRLIVERTEEATTWAEMASETANFHRRVLTMSGNPVLDLWAATLQQTSDYREGSAMPPETIEAIRREHLAIGRAILDHDPDAAERLMAAHMDGSEARSTHSARYLRQRIEWR
jgi:DNA-binding FadR family transcriptional regulator